MTTDPNDVRRRAGLFVFLSLAVAGGTAWVGYSLVSRHEARLAAEMAQDKRISVVVARRSLPAGAPILADDLEVASRPEAGLPPDAIFTSVEAVAGQTPRQEILAGEPIRTERLQVGPGGLEAQVAIEQGARAVSVRVEVAAAVAGLLEPGFCVDVIVTVRPEERAIKANWVTETILQDVRVIAVEDIQALEEDGRPSPRRDVLVTMEVGPEEAERLAMAASLGELRLALRHVEDHHMLEHRGPLVTNAMVGLSTTSESAKSRRQAWSTAHRKARGAPTATSAEVIQGSKVDVERFDAEGNKLESKSRGR